MLSIVAVVISLVIIYSIGAFPTGYLISRLNGVDITAQGSGNVGATNVSRVLGKRAGLLTLVCDVCKGTLAVVLASLISDTIWFVALAAFVAVAGHCFSIPKPLQGSMVLKGGKGVATALGVVVVLYPLGAAAALTAFIIVFFLSRIVSLSSIAAALIVPVMAFATNQDSHSCWALAAIGFLVIARHHQNIVRLIEGREPRYQAKQD
jgi:glycerol-3-phosphate acyltransferase PlsY